MAGKKVSFGAKPSTPDPDDWVKDRKLEPEEAPSPPDPEPPKIVEPEKPKMKRLTLDLPEQLHKAIKKKSVEDGVAMADLLRELLEKEFLEK